MSNKNIDDFVEKLQKEIIEKEIEDFNEYIVELFHDPPNWGKPADEDISVSHKCQDSRGEIMNFFLKIEDSIIEKANFVTDGCGATVAAGSQITLLITGKTLEFAESLKFEDLNEALGGLPDNHTHGAELALKTFKESIEKYKSNMR